jgi:hypothetical protein
MSKRQIGKEIIRGLEEIKAWKRGELKLKTHSVAVLNAEPKTSHTKRSAAGSRAKAA